MPEPHHIQNAAAPKRQRGMQGISQLLQFFSDK